MFALLLSRVFELIAEGNEKNAGINEQHPLVTFFHQPDKLDNSLLLDDSLFWGSLYLFKTAHDPTINKIANRIASRKIYRAHDVWKIAERIIPSNHPIKKEDAIKRIEIINKICQEACEKLKETAIFKEKNCYYDTYGRPIYKPEYVLGGDPQQINVEIGGEILDIASISPIVASAASFKIHRIYFDDEIAGLDDNIENIIVEHIKTALKEC